MQYIAICDDEAKQREKTKSLVIEYLKSKNVNWHVYEFDGADSLLEAYEHGEKFDCLLLDIFMPGESGIELAKNIRVYDTLCPIIFLTVSKEFALEAFGVGALQYLIKPIDKEAFFKVMEQASRAYTKDKRRHIILKTKDGSFRVPLRDILYCETSGNYQIIQLVEKKTLICRMTSRELFERLEMFEDFIRCGNSYIVNLFHVKKMTMKQVEMTNGKKIQIPRGNYNALKDKYFNFY